MEGRIPSQSHDLLLGERAQQAVIRQETDGQHLQARKVDDSSQRGEKKQSFLVKQNRKLYKGEQRRNPESISEAVAWFRELSPPWRRQ